jgi:hypothetical protein
MGVNFNVELGSSPQCIATDSLHERCKFWIAHLNRGATTWNRVQGQIPDYVVGNNRKNHSDRKANAVTWTGAAGLFDALTDMIKVDHYGGWTINWNLRKRNMDRELNKVGIAADQALLSMMLFKFQQVAFDDRFPKAIEWDGSAQDLSEQSHRADVRCLLVRLEKQFAGLRRDLNVAAIWMQDQAALCMAILRSGTSAW